MASPIIIHYFIEPGTEEAFRTIGSRVLQIALRHGAEILGAFQPAGNTGVDTPDEIHILRFPTPENTRTFLTDPDRKRLEGERPGVLRKSVVYQSAAQIPYSNLFETVVSIRRPEIVSPGETPLIGLEDQPGNDVTRISLRLQESIAPIRPPQDIETVIHTAIQPTQKKLSKLVLQWQQDRDKRVVFAHTYLLMTSNMLEALDQGEYYDRDWVGTLLERFAGYYFTALDQFEMAWFAAPPIWRVAFQAAENPQTMTAQPLLLGVNAHINHDLVLTLIDMLQPEWAGLSASQRMARYHDHTYVNTVIARTMEATQQEIINRYSPVLDVLNKALFNMDSVMMSRLISQWREKVWDNAVEYLSLKNRDKQHNLLQRVEYDALRRADAILLKRGPFRMKRLL